VGDVVQWQFSLRPIRGVISTKPRCAAVSPLTREAARTSPAHRVPRRHHPADPGVYSGSLRERAIRSAPMPGSAHACVLSAFSVAARLCGFQHQRSSGCCRQRMQ
jgi:hypothetical protein